MFDIDTLPTSLRGRRKQGSRPQRRGKNKKRETFVFRFRTPSGARTLDPNIKSVVLYQLS